MKLRSQIFLLFLFLISKTYSQNDTINKTDSLGKKNGLWILKGKDKPNMCYKPEQIAEEGYYKNGKKTGIWKEYFCNGNLKNSVTFENGKPSGIASIYYENGKIQESGLFINNRWTGKYYLYYDNGSIQHEFYFNEKGKREGKQYYYYKSGNIAIIGYFKEGKEDSCRNYFENGKIEGFSYFKNGECDSCKSYFENGKIAKVFYKDSIKIIYNKNGKIELKLDCKKEECDCDKKPFVTNNKPVQLYNSPLYNHPPYNNKTGFFYSYYGNKNVSFKAEYKNGRMYGERFCYDYYGNPTNGKFTIYRMAKLKERDGYCINGKPEGESKVYDKEGNVIIKANYHNGKPEGNTYYYNNNKLYLTENYKDGEFVYEVREKTGIDTTTKLKEYNEFPVLMLNGKQTLYNSKKQITKEGTFKNNQLIEGKAYFYNENGILTRIAIYKNGVYIRDEVIEK